MRLEILANEDADVDKEIWSKSDHKCWQLPSEHDLEKGCWLKVQLRAQQGLLIFGSMHAGETPSLEKKSQVPHATSAMKGG